MLNIKPLKIGKIKIENPIILAPMVDVTSLPFRILCKKNGAGLTFTEMLYIDAIAYENLKTNELMRFDKKEKPLGIQITGTKIENFKKAIPRLKEYSIVDLNCGCPSSKIIGNKSGSYLLKNPEKIAEIIRLLKKEGLTVTAKIRLGFDKDESIKIAKTIENAGADALTVHGRLASTRNSTPADWIAIKKIKQTIKIPVIGNGDIFTPKDAHRMFNETNCDGIMIARGALSNPLIFKQIKYYLKNNKEIPIGKNEKISQLKKYISLSKKYNMIDISRTKYISCSIISGFEKASQIRTKIMSSKTLEEIEEVLNKIS